jgi:hypothetical protein
MMMRQALVLVSALVVLAGCASDPDRVPPSQQRWMAQGEPVTCINISQIRRSNVVDDRTIEFVMNGRNRMFRNELPMRCTGLGFNRGFTHNGRSGQLCSMNTITVLETNRRAGAVCGLGRFQPMVPVPPPLAPPPPPPAP